MAELTFIIPDVAGLGRLGGTPMAARTVRSKAKIADIANLVRQPDTSVATVPAVRAALANTAAVPANQGRLLMSDREIDQQLVERAQAGDKRAFELLVIKYQRKVERLLSRLIRDHAEIEDVTQEAFIKAYRALPNFRGDSAFYTWLYRIAVNSAKNYLMTQGRRAPTSTDFDAEEAEGFEDASLLRDIATPDAQLMSKQIAEIVNTTIDKLPEELKTAITLREIDGMSYEEIAQIMDCPIGTVRSRIFRAREAVAEQLRPQMGTSKDRRW